VPLPTAPTDAETVLEGLDPEQRQVALALRGPVCVLAGAGTGKTRAITHRIAYGVLTGTYVAPRVLAVTFTARAAGELRARLRGLGVEGVQARTFHAAALRQLRYFWPRHVGGDLPNVVAQKAPLVAEAASRLRIAPDRAVVRDLAAEVEWAKVTLTDADAYPDAALAASRDAPAGLDRATVSRFLHTYDDVKRDRGVIDFEDVLLLAAGLLADVPQVAEAVRGQYHQVVVDEYQDVSPLQQQLLDLWLGGRDEICVVGDPAQTIYSFAGATPEHLLGFPARFRDAQVVHLVRDYRSTPQVVGLANGLLAKAPTSAERVPLVAQRADGPAPTFAECSDEAAEAALVAGRISGLAATGVALREMAVLFRINAQSEAYEQALSDAGVPYVVRGGERFFDRQEVKQARMLLRSAAVATTDGADDPPVEAVVAARGGMGWSRTPPAASGATRERWESLSAIVALAEDLAAGRPGLTLRDVVDELEDRAASQHAPDVEGVTLASLHAAKGLEWDAVFLAGLHDGMIPISHALDGGRAEAVEEERRLLYVGVTRARVHLHLSWAVARAPGGRASREPSRFLDGLRPGAARASAGASNGRARRRTKSGPVTCRVCGSALATAVDRKLGRHAGCPSSYDEALYAALRDWRTAQAKEADLPAYCIFTDATLTAIAEARPADERALVAIPGVGPSKLRKFGPDVLAMCAGD
jgi:ATP-dependent DNA helicase UvrD/PcrA